MPRRNHDYSENEFDQAQEVPDQIEEESPPIDPSQSEGEDLLQDASKDYQPIKELDIYQDEGVDDEQAELNPEARRRADKEIQARYKERHLEEQIEEYMSDDDFEEEKRRRHRDYYEISEDFEEIDQKRYLDPENCKGKLSDWIKESETLEYIKQKFIKLLTKYKGVNDCEDDRPIYKGKLDQMCIENHQSLEINYHDLKTSASTLALWLGLNPAILLPELNLILYTLACRLHPSYKNIVKECFVKVYDLPIIDFIRQLRFIHISKLIKVQGVVTVRSEIFSELKKITYKCYKCGAHRGPYYINNSFEGIRSPCVSCQSQGPWIKLRGKSVYRNYQKITLQESPAEVLPGRIPRSKEVILMGDNVDRVKPGDEVEVIGIYLPRYECLLNSKVGYPVYNVVIEANSIRRLNEKINFDLYSEEKFIKFSETSGLSRKIYQAMAPSIYGHLDVKEALTLAMFGGVEKKIEDKGHRIRGDINVLMLGDPGISKSQFLKSLQRVFHRCVYTTGKGASAVGLTASVRQDKVTNEWRLEAGALVLADRGLCLIDEFDKMNEQDRTSIHEAMQQQTISISKAGIVANLKARCSVIAAANPLQGRYNEQINFADNVNLSDPILSRFDVLCVMKDKPQEQLDEKLSTFVINSHMESHPYIVNSDYKSDLLVSAYEKDKKKNQSQQLAKIQFLKQYIRYAKDRCRPLVSSRSSEHIKSFYKKLRDQSKSSGGMFVGTRHLQSTIRLCEAHAKMHLRNQTTIQDAQVAVRVMLRSFLETQKYGTAQALRRVFHSYL